MTTRLSLLIAATAAALLSACGGSGGNSPPPSISAQPTSQAVLTGGTATFTVSASDGVTPTDLSYQWQMNGTSIPGATSSTFVTTPATWQSNNTSYAVTVTNPSGSVTSTAATLTLQLSSNQQIAEMLILSPNSSSSTDWNLTWTGAPSGSGVYFESTAYSTPMSPLTSGPQTVTSTYSNMSKTLSQPTTRIPARYLVNGAIMVGNLPNVIQYSYNGSNLQSDYLATDGKTVVASYITSGYKNIPLTGTVASAPADFAQYFNQLYFNPLLLNSTATWASGSSYNEFTSTALNDYYQAFDYASVQSTTNANIIPAATGTSLTAAINTGIKNGADGVTYNLSNGSMSSVNGFPIYVSNAPRASSANTTTPYYMVFFGLNGNVYAANLYKAGTVMGGNVYAVSAPGTSQGYTLNYSQQYQIRLNSAAANSLKAAFNY